MKLSDIKSDDTNLSQLKSNGTSVSQLKSNDTSVSQLKSNDTSVSQLKSNDTSVSQLKSNDTSVSQLKSNDTSVSQLRKKAAVILAFTMTLLFLSGCRTTEPENNIPDYTPSIIEDNPVKAFNDAKAIENAAENAEPLSHSIKSIADAEDDIIPTTVLGKFSTYYGDSSEERMINIENAARKIDNTVLKPGEEFSCYDKISPFTEKNGYKPAGTYSDGKVIKSIGGGVCQISTTLYNAALYAELKITERASHSMTVSYVDVSMDAAIAGDYKDLKFVNSLSYPISISAVTEDGWLIFEIEGIDVRNPNREIKFETVILSKTEPGKDVITIDKSMDENYRKVTQTAHTGYEAELYKIIYENGIKKERILINKSSYRHSPRYVTVGKT